MYIVGFFCYRSLLILLLLSVIKTILRGKDDLTLKIVQELVKTVFMSIAALLLLKELFVIQR